MSDEIFKERMRLAYKAYYKARQTLISQAGLDAMWAYDTAVEAYDELRKQAQSERLAKEKAS
jgi:hypothetical protein